MFSKIFDKLNIKKKNQRLKMGIVIAIFCVMSLVNLDVPGLYLDAVNPDYFGLHILHSDNVPSWTYSDNVIASFLEGVSEYSHFPTLNSLYGTCYEAYITMVWGAIFGYDVFSLRVLHVSYFVLLLLGVYFLLSHIFEKKNDIAIIITFLISVDPSLIFCSRTQFYIQLFPHIFFFFGLLLVIKSVFCDEGIRKKCFWGAFLLGISASSYFVFALYFIAVFCVYVYLSIRKKTSSIKEVVILVCGYLGGFFVYIYGHLSIVLTQGVSGWINAIKGLDTYGISDGAKATLGERFLHIIDRLTCISGGADIIQIITGFRMGNLYGKLFAVFFLISVVLSVGLLIRKRQDIANSKKLLTLLFLIVAFLVHLVFALLLGNALGYQHFTMLLPIMYIVMGISYCELMGKWVKRKHVLKIGENIILILLILFLSAKTYMGYDMINQTGGIGYYSKAINNISYYLDSISTEEDTIISPQWGYWMQIACITNGERQIWNESDQGVLQWRIENLSRGGKFYILVDNKTDVEMIKELMDRNGYELDRIEEFHDYGEILSPKVYVYCP